MLTYDIHNIIYLYCRNPASAYYRILLANAATSALRLHQRLPAMQISVQFLTQLFKEDSCHYLLYSVIFLYVSPNIRILYILNKITSYNYLNECYNY